MLVENKKIPVQVPPSRRALPVLTRGALIEPSETLQKTPAARYHLIEGATPLVFLLEGSRLFAVEPELFAELKTGAVAVEEVFPELLAPLAASIADFDSLAEPTAISLNVAQSCNLSCGYCYADEGRFGGKAGAMTSETAFAAIDNLLAGAGDRPVTVGFMGGEPFVNRKVLHASVAYARRRAAAQNTKIRFSVTTNGTLLQPADIELLRANGFSVTVSLDGAEQTNNRLRRSKDGSSSFARTIENLKPLLRKPGAAKLAARATVTRADLRVRERVASLAAVGFADIGVSPLRQSPDASLALTDSDWSSFLNEMIRAAEDEILRLQRGEKLRFSNFAEALRQIHRGASRNLPCGSASNYVSVAADGNYFSCHRTIDNEFFAFGNTADGLSAAARRRFLSARQVDRQEPCSSCWARYLCGGGCHAEVAAVGRGGCDYIRGWLEFCLRSYDRLASANLLPFDF